MNTPALLYFLALMLFLLWVTAPVVYSDRLVPDGSAGCARGPVVFIRPGRRGDRGLLMHERTHVKQWWRSAGLMSLRYKFSRTHRLAYEVEAYREQARHYPEDRRRVFAEFIASSYDLNVTADQAEALLRKA